MYAYLYGLKVIHTVKKCQNTLYYVSGYLCIWIILVPLNMWHKLYMHTCKYLASCKRSGARATNRLWAILRWRSEWRLPRASSSITLRLLEARLSHSNFFNWPKAFEANVERLLCERSKLLNGILHEFSWELANPRSETSWIKLPDKSRLFRLLRLQKTALGKVHKLLPLKNTHTKNDFSYISE